MNVEEVTEALIGEGLATKTVAIYRVAIIRALEWCEVRGLVLDELRPSQIAAFIESVPNTKASRAQCRAALGRYWTLVGRTDAPERAIRVPKRPRMRCRALDDHQAAVLAAVARRRRDREGLAVLFGLYAGLRRAEIAGLRWRQIEPSGWLTLVGKGDVTRAIPLHPVLVDALAAHPHPATPERAGRLSADWLFPGRFGGPVNPETIWEWIRRVAASVGLNVTTHELRHTALATALDRTRDLRAVQELAGHARPETTAGYTRVRARRLVETVEAIDYEDLEAVG